jgi:hypothetical protein
MFDTEKKRELYAYRQINFHLCDSTLSKLFLQCNNCINLGVPVCAVLVCHDYCTLLLQFSITVTLDKMSYEPS